MLTKKELGLTEEGRAWCLKALHPSESAPEVMGIPDRSGQDTVMIHFTSRYVLGRPIGYATTTWDADLSLLPNPVAFLGITFHDGNHANSATGTCYNTQLGTAGATAGSKVESWLALAQRWRIAYESMTVELDASALYNSGNVVAANAPVKARKVGFTPMSIERRYKDHEAAPFVTNAAAINFDHDRLDIGIDGVANYAPLAFNALAFQSGDEPDYDTLINMPRAYQGLAKDGVYMPLCLSHPENKWFGEQNVCYFAGTNAFTFPTSGTKEVHAMPVGSATANAVTAWPFAAALDSHTSTGTFINPISGAVIGAPGGAVGGMTSGMKIVSFCNQTWSHACFRNLSENATLVVTVRCGFEIEAQPGTTLSTQLAPSPLYDPLALDAYYAIRREMADAYPASYNDLNKLLKVVVGGGRIMLPYLSHMFPQLAPLAAPLDMALQAGGKFLDSRRKSPGALADEKKKAVDKRIKITTDMIRAAAPRRRLK